MIRNNQSINKTMKNLTFYLYLFSVTKHLRHIFPNTFSFYFSQFFAGHCAEYNIGAGIVQEKLDAIFPKPLEHCSYLSSTFDGKKKWCIYIKC